ncbi:hypothetical protein L218DRAFT_950605 [Marasmius fiardii PR-910]|nr:hypothetical protein L218DRAFT_950605 [Marasmius fiardii PR-910]
MVTRHNDGIFPLKEFDITVYCSVQAYFIEHPTTCPEKVVYQLNAAILAGFSLASVTSAWHLKIQDLHQNTIVDRSGTLPEPCRTLESGSMIDAYTLHWTASPLARTITLYGGVACAGRVLGRSSGNWNVIGSALQSVRSYKIDP